MTATLYDLIIDQGTDYERDWVIEQLTDDNLPYDPDTNPYIPFDLTGCTANMAIRTTPDTAPVLVFSEVYGIQLNGALGTFSLTITASDSNSVVFTGLEYQGIYNLEILSGRQVYRTLQGNVFMNRNLN